VPPARWWGGFSVVATKNSYKGFANLSGGNAWSPVQTCVTATLIIDAVDVH